MNYYSHHIGDFNNATRHLTRVEQSVYRDSIELYYDTESVLTKDFDKLARRLLCVSDVEKTALKDILNEFYEETDAGWLHVRCEQEITKYRANTSNKAKAGIASALSKKNKSTQINTCSTDVQLTNNQEPLTNNQEPLKTKQKPSKKIETNFFTDINPQIVLDYLAVRKAKAKNSPITQTAFDGLQREATKAGYTIEQALTTCVERNWVGFNAEWLLNDRRQTLRDKPSRMDISKIDYKAGINADGSF